MAEAVVEERQLLKTLRWYDGFVIALANPGFLLGSLGYSVGDLGGWGAVAPLGHLRGLAFFIMTLYSEMAAMFPDKPGGFPLYAHEGVAEVLRRSSARSRRSATGSAGPSCSRSSGSSSAQIIQGAWFPGEPGGSHRPATGTSPSSAAERRSAARHRRRADPRRLALQRLRRRASASVRVPRRRAADDPALLLMILPFIGDWSFDTDVGALDEQPGTDAGASRGAASGSRSSGCGSCAGRRGASMRARRSRPEYKDTVRRHPPRAALRGASSRSSSTSCSRSAFVGGRRCGDGRRATTTSAVLDHLGTDSEVAEGSARRSASSRAS